MTRLTLEKFRPNPDEPGYLFNPAWLSVAAVLFFAAVTLLGNPFFYDQGNSGRYLSGVLKTVDPQLFPQDQVVEALSRFESIFYSGLGALMELAGTGPEALEPVMFFLYIAAKISLIGLLFWMIRGLGHHYLPFVLIAAWAAHSKALPLGGTPLFVNGLRHTEVAFLILIASIGFLFRRRYLMFWLLAATAVFVHTLLALHFLLIISPPLLVWWLAAGSPQSRRMIIGFLIATAAVVIYYLQFAPTTFTAEETAVFLASKGNINHISFEGTVWHKWLALVTLIGLTGLSYWQILRKSQPFFSRRQTILENEPNRPIAAFLLAGAILGGTILALILSLLATQTGHPLLALLQPLRMFVWIVFLAHLLLALAAALIWHKSPFLGITLLAFFLFTIIDTYWSVAFGWLGIAILTLPAFATWSSFLEEWEKKFIRLGIAGLIALVFIASLFSLITNRELPLNLGHPALLFSSVALLLMVSPLIRGSGGRYMLTGLLVLISLASASQDAYEQYSDVVDPDWDAVTRWAAENTEKSDRFISTYTADTFRVRSMRTAVSHNYSALAWVAPQAFIEGREQATQIQAGLQEGQWNLTYLADLAYDWQVAYIILEGAYEPVQEPLFQSGRISVVAVEAD